MEDKERFIEEINQLYKSGKYGEVIKQIREKYPELIYAPPEILEILAWCYYRNNQYQEVRSIIKIAKSLEYSNLEAIELQLRAYVDGDIKAALSILEKDTSDPRICNAFIIAARNQKSPETYVDFAKELVKKHELSSEIAAIHMQNNFGRLLLAIGQAIKANGQFMIAYVRYGEEGNFHHRAAILYWQAKGSEELGDIDTALSVINRSCHLWRQALDLDPENRQFAENLANAKAYTEELHKKS